MSPRSLQPSSPCQKLCLILGSQLAGWPGGVPCFAPARENRGLQGAWGDGEPTLGSARSCLHPQLCPPRRGLRHNPRVSLHPWGTLPPTWVLRGGVGQEETSSRAVAGAVEQDGHGAGVCQQERGGGDGVPAVGPCRQGRGHGEDGAPRGQARHPDFGVSPPLAQPSPGPGGLRHLGCA